MDTKFINGFYRSALKMNRLHHDGKVLGCTHRINLRKTWEGLRKLRLDSMPWSDTMTNGLRIAYSILFRVWVMLLWLRACLVSSQFALLIACLLPCLMIYQFSEFHYMCFEFGAAFICDTLSINGEKIDRHTGSIDSLVSDNCCWRLNNEKWNHEHVNFVLD